MKPGVLVKEPDGTTVRVNKAGFRGEELLPKAVGEYRILSLGESTTYGAGVEQEETYSYLLQKKLNSLDSTRTYNVLNCGVSAYSSFQMLKFLELQGLAFEPDMVLLYSEVNDYLPSTLRSFGYDETTLTLSDQQLFESSARNWASAIIDHWALAKFLTYRYAVFKTKKLSAKDLPNPLEDIGLTDGISERVVLRNDGHPVSAGLREKNLGSRVKPQERINNLLEFKRKCDQRGIPLIVIHPSYLRSKPHDCILTATCGQQNMQMFDAYKSLHMAEIPTEKMFLDSWHPTSLGHSLLAKDLASFIYENELSR